MLTANGSVSAVVDGPARIAAHDTSDAGDGFGGGTVTIYTAAPDGDIVASPNTQTAPFDKLVDFPRGSKNIITLSLSDATNPTLLLWIQGADSKDG